MSALTARVVVVVAVIAIMKGFGALILKSLRKIRCVFHLTLASPSVRYYSIGLFLVCSAKFKVNEQNR